jgi:uncharacterized protein (DUF1697 family)
MNIHIALFRGINVGGKNILPMKELVTILKKLRCRNVRTYIQSGNAVFESNENSARLSQKISAEIRRRRGFEPQVLLLKPGDLETAMHANPFHDAEAAPQTLHIGFLASVPGNPDLQSLEKLRAGTERFRLISPVFYLDAPDGVGRSRLAANAERLLGVPMTDRNWRTVCKLRDMVMELS